METRSLSEVEKQLLDKLASVFFPGRDEIVEQLKNCTAKPTEDMAS